MGLGNNAAALPLTGARLTAGHFRTAVLEEDGEEEKRKRGEKNTTKNPTTKHPENGKHSTKRRCIIFSSVFTLLEK